MRLAVELKLCSAVVSLSFVFDLQGLFCSSMEVTRGLDEMMDEREASQLEEQD